MITEHIPEFPSSHDPDDTVPRNVGIGRRLRDYGATFESATVELDESNSDDELEIFSVAYSAEKQRIGFMIRGGSVDAEAADPNTGVTERGYLIRIRIQCSNGIRIDRSVWQRMRQH